MEHRRNVTRLYDSSISIDSHEDPNEFDIRNYMNYDMIKRMLISHPTELSLFEITCILVNTKINDKKQVEVSKKKSVRESIHSI